MTTPNLLRPTQINSRTHTPGANPGHGLPGELPLVGIGARVDGGIPGF